MRTKAQPHQMGAKVAPGSHAMKSTKPSRGMAVHKGPAPIGRVGSGQAAPSKRTMHPVKAKTSMKGHAGTNPGARPPKDPTSRTTSGGHSTVIVREPKVGKKATNPHVVGKGQGEKAEAKKEMKMSPKAYAAHEAKERKTMGPKKMKAHEAAEKAAMKGAKGRY